MCQRSGIMGFINVFRYEEFKAHVRQTSNRFMLPMVPLFIVIMLTELLVLLLTGP